MAKNRVAFLLILVLVAALAACGANNLAELNVATTEMHFAMEADAWVAEPTAQFRRDTRSYGGFGMVADIAVGGIPSPVVAPISPPPTPSPPGQAVAYNHVVRHLIQTAHATMETEEFDAAVSDLRNLVQGLDGYVESEMLTTHRGNSFTIVMRVPAPRFDYALERLPEIAEIRSLSRHAEDVTAQFYDLMGNLETRRIEEERILALIDEANNVTDLLALETRLSNTRMIIETYLAQLESMTSRIAFSTINVTLFDTYREEIVTIAPTLGNRIGGAFGNSVDGVVSGTQNIIVFLAAVILPGAILGVIGFAGYKIFSRFKRRSVAQ